MTNRQRTGRLGEVAARRHIESLGYLILGTNIRHGRYEIDIVADDDGTLVFIEVRTRRNNRLGTPEESITPEKRERMLAGAHSYLEEHGSWQRDWRIDIVAVELDRLDRVAILSVIRNALES